METKFDMTDLGILNFFLGLEFVYTTKGIILHQRRYVQEVLKRFNTHKCNEVVTPIETNVELQLDEAEKSVDGTLYKQIVGSLRFLCNSRPAISFGVGLISMFMSNPKVLHMATTKMILRYLKGTQNYGLMFPQGNEQIVPELEPFSNSDWSGDAVERKSRAHQGIYFYS